MTAARNLDRYTDEELLHLLLILATDNNNRPTQREVLADDRLPTHHTYRQRFGSLDAALTQAGIGHMKRKQYTIRDVVRGMLKGAPNIRVKEEGKQIGQIVVDFVLQIGDSEIMLDLIDLPEADWGTIGRAEDIRRFAVEQSGDPTPYMQATSAWEAINRMKGMMSK